MIAAIAQQQALPIAEVLSTLAEALATHDTVILQAPPGAGKTTIVPLMTLEQPWLGDKNILMLEPRRLAARAAAERMSALIQQPLGQTVGYRVRQEAKVSAQTRIEVLTEGLFVRRLQSEPELEGIGLLIFDEFHERHLDGDLALALVQQARELFCEDIKILLMSATLDNESLQAHFPGAPLICSEGKQFPVELHYSPKPQRDLLGPNNFRLPQAMLASIDTAMALDPGSLLCFLPGQGEIKRCAELLQQRFQTRRDKQGQELVIVPLYGDLALAEQRRAVAPAQAGQRKIVLATDIAESSLTITGVSVVVDSGLRRSPVFDPNTGMSRLATLRISQASARQRAGRAGRLGPGYCLRLWQQSEQAQLAGHAQAEIQQADLSELCLQAASWGASSLDELNWLTPPPQSAAAQACDLLASLGALAQTQPTADGYWPLSITPHGERLSQIPTHPRLAHMLTLSAQYGNGQLGAELAALLSEKDPLSRLDVGADISRRLHFLRGQEKFKVDHGQLSRLKQNLKQFLRLLPKQGANNDSALGEDRALGLLLALAYPDRIAQRKGSGHNGWLSYQLSNGRQAILDPADPLAKEELLVVAALGGRQGDSKDRIFLAAPCALDLLQQNELGLVQRRDYCQWQLDTGRFVAEQHLCLGALILERKPLTNVSAELRLSGLYEAIRKQGIDSLPWNKSSRQWRARAQYMHQYLSRQQAPEQWPDFGDKALLDQLEQWLAMYVQKIKKFSELATIDLLGALKARLDWADQQRLDQLLPERIEVPSGSSIGIDYSQRPPVLAVKLQEMFGLAQSPKLLQGELPLAIHLLSPAQRPLAVTQDLASFWAGPYAEVKKEMKGRYPKHPWPDDPLSAVATAKTKARLRAEQK